MQSFKLLPTISSPTLQRVVPTDPQIFYFFYHLSLKRKVISTPKTLTEISYPLGDSLVHLQLCPHIRFSSINFTDALLLLIGVLLSTKILV